ncbi:MAG: sulfotransferase domain-containing protein [Alphaproteobacteria bacterium]
MQNVLLTGIPRSGLTVVSALLDGLEGCVALNEPAWQHNKTLEIRQPLPYCKWLVGDFLWQRHRLLSQDPVRDFRGEDGKHLLDSKFDPNRIVNNMGAIGNTMFTQPGLQQDFTLIMKQHILYTALLPRLVHFNFFKIIVVIRHPFDVIQSWQKLQNDALSQGRILLNKKWWPEVDGISAQQNVAALERMVQLYEAFCQRYYELGDAITVIKYEDMTKDPTQVSRLIGHQKPSPAIARLELRPRMLMKEQAGSLQELFRKYSVFTQNYYGL